MHHLLGHDHAVMELPAGSASPTEVHVHDYAWLLPAHQPGRRRRGAIAASPTRSPPARPASPMPAAASRRRSASPRCAPAPPPISPAPRRVVVPSHRCRRRLRRHFPGLAPVVVRTSRRRRLPEPPPPVVAAAARVCVVGASACDEGLRRAAGLRARCGRSRDLRCEFVVVGQTPDDARLLATGRSFVTGPYRRRRTAWRRSAASGRHLGLLPSVGRKPGATRSASAGRPASTQWRSISVRRRNACARTGRGWVLPLGLPAAAVNNALLAVAPLRRPMNAPP